jgi:hypothetical protein
MDRYSHTVLGELADGLEALPNLDHAAQAIEAVASGTDGRTVNSDPQQHPQQPAREKQRLAAGLCADHNTPALTCNARKPLPTAALNGKSRPSATSSKTPAAYPSGSRGRIANPLFVGSNPTSASLSAFVPRSIRWRRIRHDLLIFAILFCL